MARRLPLRDDPLDDIAARIVGAMRPWRIVLFGSRARGEAKDHSDYDVFVEIDDTGTSLREIHDRIRGLFPHAGLTIDFKVALPGQIERRRDDPGTIEWDVAREGRVLYADPAAPTTLAPPRRVSEPSDKPPESVSEWLEAAERDIRHLEHLLTSEADFSPEVCWLSHQTSEKHLKALLVARRVRPKRTHDLVELLAMLRASGCVLPDLDDDCKLLTGHAITPRYPAGLSLNAANARIAFAAAERLIAAVRTQLPPAAR